MFCCNITLDINTFYWYIFSLIVWQSGLYGLVAKKFLCLLPWDVVLCTWRDTIAEGQNYYSAPALGSYTRRSGKF